VTGAVVVACWLVVVWYAGLSVSNPSAADVARGVVVEVAPGPGSSGVLWVFAAGWCLVLFAAVVGWGVGCADR